MILRRIIWALSVILCALAFVFVNSPLTGALLILVIVLPIVSLIIALLSKKHISADIKLQQECICGESAAGEIIAENKSKLLFPAIEVTLKSENVKTLENSYRSCVFSLKPNSVSKEEFEVKTEHCGLIRFSVDRLYAVDYFRLFRFKINCEGADSVIALPKTFETKVFIEDEFASADSSNIIKKNATPDTSETVGIREYVIGDSVSDIHWKLSQKTDRLLVKEFGRTVVNKVLVFADTALYDGMTAGESDFVCVTFASILQSLFDDEAEFFAGFWGYTVNVTRQSELDEAVRKLLSAKCEKGLTPLEKINPLDYSKVIFITPSNDMAEAERIKVLSYRADFESLKVINI